MAMPNNGEPLIIKELIAHVRTMDNLQGMILPTGGVRKQQRSQVRKGLSLENVARMATCSLGNS